MRTLKGWIATTCLAIVLVTNSAPVHASIIVAGRTSATAECSETTKMDTKGYLGSIIVAGLGSVIVGGFGSIIIGGGFTSAEPVNCSIIVAG